SVRARSPSTTTKALIFGLSASMRSNACSVSSREETFPVRTCSASDASDSLRKSKPMRRGYVRLRWRARATAASSIVVVSFPGKVARGRAPHGGGDEAVGEPEPVVAVEAGGLVGVAGAVEGGEQPLARPVAGEDPPGAVAAVGRRRQPEDEEARPGIPEAGDR